ncbi:MAG: selenocysteine-specific translation elongation factor, partial [Methylacidiphilales bacterium]|nr:selenocysteine-specific translation elongation factor [Candidatus Methylacidiphilales bacterium]
MDTKYFIVGTAGHIDHGKSALVEALTGTRPDRLEEEKRRGITIDLGFAFLNMDGVRLGFVDVPGHERFVRNMLAGAGGIDLLMLVVAADESIKPQTREHFDICRLLAIPRGLVAITKSDLVDPSTLDLVRLEIEEYVRGSFFEHAAIVPVSALTGAGLGELKDALRTVAQSAPLRDACRHLRLPIDRSFAMKGFGTVVTGTLVSGNLKIEDEVELYPTGRRLRVRGLQSEGRALQKAVAGQRTAVNLAGIDHAEIKRGMVLAPPGIFEPTGRIDARVSLLRQARPLKNRARVRFHQGTFETAAEVILLDRDELAPADSAFAQLRLAEKTLLLAGDRFILRQFSPATTIGGGVVIEAKAPRHRHRDPSIPAYLSVLEQGSRPEILQAMVDAAPNGLALEEIVARTGWLESEISDAARSLSEKGQSRVIGEQPPVVASAKAVANIASALRLAVEKYHKENPLLAGIPRQELRAKIGNPRPELFEASLNDLRQAGVIGTSGDFVHAAGRKL